ncbi:MAG: hypothetical protein EOQ50_24320 [Mesorhizobium sp.]|uniref:hypothetical protein n=1 Tax=Mesorhizobium sp. TaxID=1871066 RepID=UPI000FE5A033|nr:hypothetical protein [Mesorhizobium sp.]RWB70434.1 MAG: hypothetical protein EOQ50_24320 [Mesorhizobium sp.]
MTGKAGALLTELAATPAQSLASVIAKLAVVVREANDNTDIFEFPLLQSRSALDDLQRLIQAAITYYSARLESLLFHSSMPESKDFAPRRVLLSNP